MKNVTLFILFLFFLPFTINAQFGVKAGANLSYLLGTDNLSIEKRPKAGFQFGVVYKHLIADEEYAIQPELKYIRKGANFKIDSFNVTGQLNYWEVPVMGMINLLGGTVSLQAGPQFSYLTSANYVFEKDGEEETFEDELDTYNRFDTGIAFGMSLNLDYFFVEFRFNIGLLNIDKGTNVNGLTYAPNSKNSNAELSVGYYF